MNSLTRRTDEMRKRRQSTLRSGIPFWLLVWAAFFGCSSGTPGGEVQSEGAEDSRSIAVSAGEVMAGAETEREMIPSVSEQEVFVQWWQGEASGLRLRIPVKVQFSPLGVSGAWILEEQEDREPAIKLVLDDSRLGVGLAERVAALCEDAPCMIWAEGVVASVNDRLRPPMMGEAGEISELRLILESVQGIEPEDRLEVQILK